MTYTNKNIHINGMDIKPGQNAQVSLNWYQLPTKTVVEIPVYVFRSKNPGPVLLILAGMHGDEINGIEIVRRLITRDDVKKPLCGTIIAIPVINTISFLSGSRDLPDGRDLNRCFPGTKNGSLGGRIAYDLMNEIIPQIDFVRAAGQGERIKRWNGYPRSLATRGTKQTSAHLPPGAGAGLNRFKQIKKR